MKLLIIPMLIFSTLSGQTLKEHFQNNFEMGTIYNASKDLKSTAGKQIAVKHFSVLTTENLFKWISLSKKEGEYRFDNADKSVRFCEESNLKLIGHTLIWKKHNPEWLFKDSGGQKLTREVLLKRMEHHIKRVVSRYKGRIYGWDVVNEAFENNGAHRDIPWSKIIGPDYIDYAFKYASEADPGAELYYNDFGLFNEKKLSAVIDLIKRLKSKKIRIDAVGMQCHLHLTWPDLKKIENAIIELNRAGVKVVISELDLSVLPNGFGHKGKHIRDLKGPLNPYAQNLADSKEQEQSQKYLELFKMFMKHSDKIQRVTFWGISDKHSWLNEFPILGRTDYPLLFDRNYKPKNVFLELMKLR